MSENPYQSSETTPEATSGDVSKDGKGQPFPWVGWLVSIGVIVLLVSLMLPATRSASSPARRNQCGNQLRQLAIAMLMYHETHGALPPAYTVDDAGNKLHSWRTLLLPYLEEQALHAQIDLTKPWDDPANAAVRKTAVDLFACPSAGVDPGRSSYCVVVGEGFAFTGAEPTTLDDATDGDANTIAIVEVPHEMAVPWMAPEDITIDQLIAACEADQWNHPVGFQVAFLDAMPRFLEIEIDAKTLRAMATRAGGEALDER